MATRKSPASRKIGELVRKGIPQPQAVAVGLNMQRAGRLTPAGKYLPVKRRANHAQVTPRMAKQVNRALTTVREYVPLRWRTSL